MSNHPKYKLCGQERLYLIWLCNCSKQQTYLHLSDQRLPNYHIMVKLLIIEMMDFFAKTTHFVDFVEYKVALGYVRITFMSDIVTTTVQDTLCTTTTEFIFENVFYLLRQ